MPPDPASTIEEHIRAFDDEETTVEDTVRDLIRAFPGNEEFSRPSSAINFARVAKADPSRFEKLNAYYR
jgi:hypothetical protein